MTELIVIGIIIVIAILGYFMESKNKAVRGASKGLFWIITLIPGMIFMLFLIGGIAGMIYLWGSELLGK